jgi:hypothetical protein
LSMTGKQLVAVVSPTVAEIVGELLSTSAGSGDQIGWLRWLIEQERWSRRLRRERGSWLCEELSAGMAPFIAADGGRGLAVRSAAATSLQGRRGTGADARPLATSRR